MELLSVSVTAYKRFRSKATLQTNGKLVALLGPNEAGKSSLLTAIAHLGHSRPLEPQEISRNLGREECRIEGRFFLNAADLEAADLSRPSWLRVFKDDSGKLTYSVEPAPPGRDIRHRPALNTAIVAMVQDKFLLERLNELPALVQELDELREELRVSDESLPAETLSRAGKIRNELVAMYDDPRPDALDQVISLIEDLLQREQMLTPTLAAIRALAKRVPQFLLFDEAARTLQSHYSINELRSFIPPALGNLLDAAELNLPDLFEAIDAGHTSKITQIERRASRVIGEKFRSVWKQSGIVVALGIQGDVLEVQIINSDDEHTALAERSDGLRQFVALQIFTTRNQVAEPVLLIDEAEQRLHYDAQADLVQMLARQTVAPKIIYTTHSAGCLPEDLGNGVRTLVADDSDSTSRIVNRFWGEDAKGLVPLLFGMGATAMAFFPTRHAVVVEGPSDMLLYPTLMREALRTDFLGFQFVPGLSSAGPAVAGTTRGVIYLVDGDDGGSTLARQLQEKGISTSNILTLANKGKTAVDLEDFIAPELLLKAANNLIERYHRDAHPLLDTHLDAKKRMDSLERAFRDSTGSKLAKVDLAYQLLDFVSADPTARLLDPRRSSTLEEAARMIIRHFDAQH